MSQQAVLEAVERASGYSPEAYRLRQAEVSPDVLTLHYQGERQPGDRAWAIRFSMKSSEQKPEDLLDLDRLLEAIAADKKGFEVRELGVREVEGRPVSWASYRYLSPLYREGKPVEAGGAAAVMSTSEGPAPLVYHLNVFNIEGDRPHLGWGELEPLAKAAIRD